MKKLLLAISLLSTPAYAFDAPSASQQRAAITLIRGAGYSCTTVDAIIPFVLAHGFQVVCDGFYYKYDVENKGGRVVVTVK